MNERRRADLTFNQLHATDYEHFSIEFHQNKYNQPSYHWTQLSEHMLFEAGFIHDYNELRLRRKSILEEDGTYFHPFREFGLDGMAIEYLSEDNKIYHGIQSKLWKSRRLTASDLGSFYQAIFMRMKMKDNRSKGYIYHSGKLQVDVRDDILNCPQIINHHLPYIEEADNTNLSNHIIQETDLILRDYQKEAIHALSQDWSGIQLLHLSCGMGKTVIFNHYLKDCDYKNVFILSPLKIQVQQNLDRMTPFLPNHKTLLLDSDANGSTDFNDLKNILEHKCIVSSTYDSAQNVMKQLFYKEKINDFEKDSDNEDLEEDDLDENSEDDYDNKDLEEDDFDKNSEEEEYKSMYDLSNSILIVDEAHNLINRNDLIEIIKSFPKVLLVTATPPSCLQELLDCDLIYQYPFNKAIENKYICDYQIYIPLVKESENGTSEIMIEKPIELKDLNNDFVYKALYLINGMLQTGSKKCIAYLASQEECKDFMDVCKKIMNTYHFLPLWIETIISDVSQEKRNQILTDFQTDLDNGLKILCSIRILNEGIDIPKCDSVFIGNVGTQSSDIIMIQRICRANRLIKNNPNKVANCFLWTKEFNKILDTLSLLKENDIEFSKKIKVMNGDYTKNGNKERIQMIVNKNIDLKEYVNTKCYAKKYDLFERSKEIVERAYKRLSEGKNFLPIGFSKNNNLTNQQLQEIKDKNKLNNIKHYINKNNYDHIKNSIDYLDTNLFGWRFTPEEIELHKAKNIIDRANKRFNSGDNLLPQHHFIKNRNTILNQEHSDAQILLRWKNKLKKNKLNNDLKIFLDNNLKNWSLSNSDKFFENVKGLVKRCKIREKENKRVFPRKLTNPKNRNTPELVQEHNDQRIIYSLKKYLSKEDCSEYYINIKKYLDEHLSGWDYNIDLVEKAYQEAIDIVKRANERKKNNLNFLPRQIKTKIKTEDEIQEKKDAHTLSRFKLALKGKNKVGNCYDKVKIYLDKELIGWRDEVDFNKEALEFAKNIVIRANKRIKEGNHLLPRNVRNKKNRTSEDLIQENKDAEKLQKFRQFIKGSLHGHNCPDEVKQYLDEHLLNWFY